VERLLVAVAFGAALLTAAYGGYLAFLRAPTPQALLQDCYLPPPTARRVASSSSRIRLGIAMLGLLVSPIVLRHPRRGSRLRNQVLALFALAAVTAARLAARWPADHLLRSVTGRQRSPRSLVWLFVVRHS